MFSCYFNVFRIEIRNQFLRKYQNFVKFDIYNLPFIMLIHINSHKISNQKQIELMKKSNPVVIPRNHKVEEALAAAEEGNFEVVINLLSILKKPYDLQKNSI